ncbi:hypothetical protein REH81_09915, partial [Vibrio rotiferianus]
LHAGAKLGALTGLEINERAAGSLVCFQLMPPLAKGRVYLWSKYQIYNIRSPHYHYQTLHASLPTVVFVEFICL